MKSDPTLVKDMKWHNYHTRILSLHIKGKSTEEIAKAVKMSYGGVRDIMLKPRFLEKKQEALKLIKPVAERVKENFEKYADTATKKIIQLSRSGTGDQRIQFEAAKEILYQVGAKPRDIVEQIRRNYPPEELASALKVIGEIETVYERLGTTKSRFLITRDITKTDTPTQSPSEEANEPVDPKP